MTTLRRWSMALGCSVGFTLAACSSKSGDQPAGGQGADGGGSGGSGATVLGHCDQQTESSANPITQACGDFTTTYGTNLKLGTYGALMDSNVGAGFENKDPADDATCPSFAAIFNEDAKTTAQLLDTGTQPCNATAPNTGSCLDYKLYSVFRPAKWPAGKIPVLSWGNGTCAQPEGYGGLLRYIASTGFFIVAANSREVGAGTEILHALDFAAAANEDPKSPYYGHLDLSKVGVMGHSQGSSGAGLAAADSRVQSVILFNGGDTNAKPFLAVSGDLDLFSFTGPSMAAALQGQAKGAYLYYHNPAGSSADTRRGHLVLMLTPERVMEAAAGWWQMTFNNDATATQLFVGASCGLCGHASDFEFGEKGL